MRGIHTNLKWMGQLKSNRGISVRCFNESSTAHQASFILFVSFTHLTFIENLVDTKNPPSYHCQKPKICPRGAGWGWSWDCRRDKGHNVTSPMEHTADMQTLDPEEDRWGWGSISKLSQDTAIRRGRKISANQNGKQVPGPDQESKGLQDAQLLPESHLVWFECERPPQAPIFECSVLSW